MSVTSHSALAAVCHQASAGCSQPHQEQLRDPTGVWDSKLKLILTVFQQGHSL